MEIIQQLINNNRRKYSVFCILNCKPTFAPPCNVAITKARKFIYPYLRWLQSSWKLCLLASRPRLVLQLNQAAEQETINSKMWLRVSTHSDKYAGHVHEWARSFLPIGYLELGNQGSHSRAASTLLRGTSGCTDFEQETF